MNDDNNAGFYSPLFSRNKNGQSTQPSPTVSIAIEQDGTSETANNNAGFGTRCSSPTSMYSSASNRKSYDSYEEKGRYGEDGGYDVYEKYNSNSTFVNEDEIIQSMSNNITKEQDLYHTSSLKSNDNIYSVELLPTDNYFTNTEAQSTSIYTTNSPVMNDDGSQNDIIYSNINKLNPPATPSTIYSINNNNASDVETEKYSVKTNDKNCNIEVISSQSDFYIRGQKGGFWRNLWNMKFFNNKKPTLKFWLALILLIVLILLIGMFHMYQFLFFSSPSYELHTFDIYFSHLFHPLSYEFHTFDICFHIFFFFFFNNQSSQQLLLHRSHQINHHHHRILHHHQVRV